MSDSATLPPLTKAASTGLKAEEKRVIFASSLGTVFEWYDFYLYATLAPFFAALFFPGERHRGAARQLRRRSPPGSWCGRSARWCSAGSATSSAASTRSSSRSSVMGSSTALVGCLPRYATIGMAGADPPRRCCGCCKAWRSAASTAAPRPTSPSTRPTTARGYYTSWIQTTATLGLFLSLLVILVCRKSMSARTFSDWGWRIPFLLSWCCW